MSLTGLYAWLSKAPPVLWHSAASYADDVGNSLTDEPLYRLVMNLWHADATELEQYYRYWKQARPQHQLLHLVNDPQVCQELQSRGIPAVFVNQNCFIDERIYTIQPEIPKEFDAVYNARMNPFKRHALLKDVPSLLLIGGLMAEGDSPDYMSQVQAALPQAVFTHDPPTIYLNSWEVALQLNGCRVGMCLSETEGAMFAAVEYLLCGLPVVSTPSQGGRDVWFDPQFTRIVEPEPQAIAAAVQELIDAQLDPAEIRAATLARMSEHRQRFTAAVQAIYRSEGIGRDFAREFYETFKNRCGAWRPNHEVAQWRESR
jgi:glycosyltransferase involved in cell wall biosynthesis